MDKRSRDSDRKPDDSSQSGDAGRKSVRRLLVRFAEKTSMVGVPYINNAKLIGARIIWIVLLLLALAAMSLHLWYLITQFRSYPYTAKVSFGFGNLRLPSVTICNTNGIHKGRLNAFEGADELKQLVNDLSPESFAPEQIDNQAFYDFYGDFFDLVDGEYVFNATKLEGITEDDVDEYAIFNPATYDPNYNDWWEDDNEIEYTEDEYDGPQEAQSQMLDIYHSLFMELSADDRNYLGHQIDDMLLSCTFNGRVCNASQFQLYQTTEYGNCWTISSNKFTVVEPGPKAGLTLDLFLEAEEYLQGITQGYGIQLEIHEPNTYPDPFSAGVLIPSSMQTNIGLRMSCRQFCQITTIMSTCGCYDDEWEEDALVAKSSLGPCNTSSQWKCVNDLERQYQRKILNCNCKNPCVETSYNKDISSRQWPTEGYSKILLKQLCDRDFEACVKVRQATTEYLRNNNFLKLNIYYEDLNFEEFKEEPDIEVAQFLSDVGGAIGLWIGLSILSLCEVIQLIIEVVDLVVHRSCKTGRHGRNSDRGANKDDYRNHHHRHDRENPWARNDEIGDRENPGFDSLDDRDRREQTYQDYSLPRAGAYLSPYSDKRDTSYLEKGPHVRDRRY